MTDLNPKRGRTPAGSGLTEVRPPGPLPGMRGSRLQPTRRLRGAAAQGQAWREGRGRVCLGDRLLGAWQRRGTRGGARAHLVVVQLLLSEDGLLVPHGARNRPGTASHSRPLSPTRIPPRSPREGRGRGRGRACGRGAVGPRGGARPGQRPRLSGLVPVRVAWAGRARLLWAAGPCARVFEGCGGTRAGTWRPWPWGGEALHRRRDPGRAGPSPTRPSRRSGRHSR